MIVERTGVFGRLGYRRSYIVATRCQSLASVGRLAQALLARVGRHRRLCDERPR